MKPATLDTRPAPIPADVPDRLSTGDVAAILGMKGYQVRHAVRRGRLEPANTPDFNAWRYFTPEAVAAFAEREGRTPTWSRVMPASRS